MFIVYIHRDKPRLLFTLISEVFIDAILKFYSLKIQDMLQISWSFEFKITQTSSLVLCYFINYSKVYILSLIIPIHKLWFSKKSMIENVEEQNEYDIGKNEMKKIDNLSEIKREIVY